jgi:integrase
MEYRKIETLIDLTKQVCLQLRNHLFENGRIKLPGESLESDSNGNPIEPSHISPTTINKVRQAVHVALEHAETVDLIPSNPMRSIRRVKEEPKERKIFERDELVKLFAQPWRDIRAYAGAMLAAATGMRLGEIRGLLYGNVHFSDGYLDVLTSYQNKEGVKPPKWGDIRYGVPLPSRVSDSLQAVVKVCPYALGDDSFLFFGDKADRPVPAYTLQHGLKQAIQSTGVPSKGRTFHCLRHTATSLIAGDAGMDRVQRLLGHTTAMMTEKYTHPTDDDRKIVLRAQNSLWEDRS